MNHSPYPSAVIGLRLSQSRHLSAPVERRYATLSAFGLYNVVNIVAQCPMSPASSVRAATPKPCLAHTTLAPPLAFSNQTCSSPVCTDDAVAAVLLAASRFDGVAVGGENLVALSDSRLYSVSLPRQSEWLVSLPSSSFYHYMTFLSEIEDESHLLSIPLSAYTKPRCALCVALGVLADQALSPCRRIHRAAIQRKTCGSASHGLPIYLHVTYGSHVFPSRAPAGLREQASRSIFPS